MEAVKAKMDKKEKTLYYLLSATIFIDFVNGIFTNIPIGEVYRTFVLLLSVYFLFKTNVKILSYVFVVGVYIFINSLISFTQTLNNFGFYFDIKMALKSVYFITIFSVIRSLYKVNKFKLNTVKKIILNNLYYTPLLFLLSYILDIGRISYENSGLGFKGTFLSLNSINVSMIVLYIFAVDGLVRNKNKIKWLILTITLVIPMVLLGTKSSLIFIVFVPVVYLLLNINVKVRFKLSSFLVYYWSFYIFSIVFLVWINLETDTNDSYIDQILYRQRFLFENRDFISYLFSGRNWLLETGIYHFFKDVSILKILFGVGYFNIHNDIAISWGMGLNDVRPVELDIFDILFSYGVLGVIFTYGFVVYHFFKGYKYIFHKKVQPYLVGTLSLLIFSVTGGHVFLEAISSTFLGLCLVGWYISTHETKLNNQKRIKQCFEKNKLSVMK